MRVLLVKTGFIQLNKGVLFIYFIYLFFFFHSPHMLTNALLASTLCDVNAQYSNKHRSYSCRMMHR